MLLTDCRFVSFKNLLEEAAYQQNIVLQTSQALNVAESSTEDKRGSPEVLEGERLLLLASKSTILFVDSRIIWLNFIHVSLSSYLEFYLNL